MSNETNMSSSNQLSGVANPYVGSTRSWEPLVWLPFSAGGVVSAFFLPGLALLLTGWFGGTWLADYQAVHAVLGNVFVKLALVVFVFLCLTHALHRLRFVASDLGILTRQPNALAVITYGLAVVGTAFAALAVFAPAAGA